MDIEGRAAEFVERLDRRLEPRADRRKPRRRHEPPEPFRDIHRSRRVEVLLARDLDHVRHQRGDRLGLGEPPQRELRSKRR